MDLKEFYDLAQAIYDSGVTFRLCYTVDGWKIISTGATGYSMMLSPKNTRVIFSMAGHTQANISIPRVLEFLQHVEDEKDVFLSLIYTVLDDKRKRYQGIVDKNQTGQDYLIENYGSHIIGNALKTPLEEINVHL